ncbi:hypothetical protein ACFXAE_11805 [Streptomyces sp. NPDC059454]|uniref:hypothetical protein n=1 Tax=Streptomyces sp. NPDC059454 TaxID=3346836 RepID=UPI0036AF341F
MCERQQETRVGARQQSVYTGVPLVLGQAVRPRQLFGQDLLGRRPVRVGQDGQRPCGQARAAEGRFEPLFPHQYEVVLVTAFQYDVGGVQQGQHLGRAAK